jgi:4-amino-4-deoxy-L-arabinose transferase-like glycosyltransferase
MDAAAVLRDHTRGVSHLFDGHLELQKPPLYYWLVAAVARWSGGEVDAWAVRLPAALAALACLLWMHVWLRERGRPVAAVLTPLILATAGQFPWLARVGRIDMPLTLCVAVALGCFQMACGRRDEGRRTWHLWLGVYLAVAAGLLLKGPIAVVLPAAVGLAHVLTGGDGRFPWRRPWRALPGSLLWGVPLVLLIAAPWFVYAHWQTHGEFTRQFFWHHNVERGFGGDDALQAHPWWFYGHTFAERFLPWSPFLGVAVWWTARRGRWRLDAEPRFGLIWLATTVLLLSCMRFKRADYLLPAFPGAALFLGCVGERWLRTLTRPRWATASFAGVVGVVVVAWWVAVDYVLPRYEPVLGQRAFATEVRRVVPSPQLVLWFRAENHALAFRLGEPLNTFLEWENLDIWAGRPGTHYILMPPECAAEWPKHVHSGRLERVMANTDLTKKIPKHQQVVLMRTVAGTISSASVQAPE